MANLLSLPSFTQNRLLLYGATSTALTASLLVNVAASKTGFYSAAVAISNSSGAVMILANFCLFISLMIGITLQRIFFGRLRTIEVEHLYDRSWYFLTESILALTMFREDFDAPFIVMFGLLLFLKCFHWIAADRVEWMDQLPPPGPPLSFHLRLVFLLLFLVSSNMILFAFALSYVMEHGVSGKVLFLAESALLHVSWTNLVGKYTLNVYERWREMRDRRAAAAGAEDEEDDRGWEGKSMAVFYVDLGTDLIKLLTYLVYFLVILVHYGLPFNILRDVYLTARSFLSRIKTLIQYRAATSNMDSRYADATREEMEVMEDKVCIICREEMSWADRSEEGVEPPRVVPTFAADGTPNPSPARSRRRRAGDRPKKLSCNHVFHLACLKSWLERQQNCPTCRRTVMTQPLGIGGHHNIPNFVAAPAPAAPAAHPHPHPHPQPTGHAPHPNGAAAPPQPGQAAAAAPARIWGAPVAAPLGFDRVPPPLPARLPAHPPQQLPGRDGNGLTFEVAAFGYGVRIRLGQEGQAAPPRQPAFEPQPPPFAAAAAPPPAPALFQAAAMNPMFMRRPIQPQPQPAATPAPTPTPTRTQPAAEGEQQRPTPIIVRNVIQYMARVRVHYTTNEPAYQAFLQLIQDYKSGALSADAVVKKLVETFGGAGDPSLIKGFATLLQPAGSKIELSSSGEYHVVPPPSNDAAAATPLPPATEVSSVGPSSATEPTPAPTQSSSDAPLPPTSPTEPIDITSLTPREVAAQAALRRSARLNPSSANSTPSPSRPRTPSLPPSSTANTAGSSVVEEPDATSSDSPPPPSIVPPTIPSVEMSTPTPTPTIPLDSVDLQPPLSSSIPIPRQPTLTPLYAPSYHSSTPLPHPHPQPFAVAEPPSPPTFLRPSLPLPATLSGDELRDADAWTRQAVEERLKVLERIDGVLGGLRGELRGLMEERGENGSSAGRREVSSSSGSGLVGTGKQAVEGPRVSRKVEASSVGELDPSKVPLPRDEGEL